MKDCDDDDDDDDEEGGEELDPLRINHSIFLPSSPSPPFLSPPLPLLRLATRRGGTSR
jgi:hypothetical protein